MEILFYFIQMICLDQKHKLWTSIHHFSYKKTPCPRNFHFEFSNSLRLSVLDGSHLSDVKFSGVMIQEIFSL